MRRGAELLREQKIRTSEGLANITLAEAEARAATSIAPSPSSTKRLRRASRPEIANSTPSCIASAARCC